MTVTGVKRILETFSNMTSSVQISIDRLAKACFNVNISERMKSAVMVLAIEFHGWKCAVIVSSGSSVLSAIKARSFEPVDARGSGR